MRVCVRAFFFSSFFLVRRFFGRVFGRRFGCRRCSSGRAGGGVWAWEVRCGAVGSLGCGLVGAWAVGSGVVGVGWLSCAGGRAVLGVSRARGSVRGSVVAGWAVGGRAGCSVVCGARCWAACGGAGVVAGGGWAVVVCLGLGGWGGGALVSVSGLAVVVGASGLSGSGLCASGAGGWVGLGVGGALWVVVVLPVGRFVGRCWVVPRRGSVSGGCRRRLRVRRGRRSVSRFRRGCRAWAFAWVLGSVAVGRGRVPGAGCWSVLGVGWCRCLVARSACRRRRSLCRVRALRWVLRCARWFRGWRRVGLRVGRRVSRCRRCCGRWAGAWALFRWALAAVRCRCRGVLASPVACGCSGRGCRGWRGEARSCRLVRPLFFAPFGGGRCAVLPFVGLCGSRCLSGEWLPLVRSVVAAVLGGWRRVAVGCARGADAAALLASLPLVRQRSGLSAPLVQVFCAFGRSAEGSWSGSAVSSVLAADALAVSPGHGCAAPVSVRWLAGGPASVPLRRRLAARSAALVRAVGRSGPGCGLVAFVAGGRVVSPGTWLSVRLALSGGVPVVVFLCGCEASALPSFLPGVGPVSWVPAGSGVWASGFRAVVGASGSSGSGAPAQ